MQKDIKITNKKAWFNYAIKDTYLAGLVLTGTEVKSLRAGKGSIAEAYCVLHNNEVYLRNANINEFAAGSYNNHVPVRDRKLLLNAQEIGKIEKAIKTKGFTLVPLELFLNEKGLFKIKIATAVGKKQYDKREDLKLKDDKREMDRMRKKKA
ncbi:MAG TPA: SsrA-binding protein SmpB [Flavobacteriales bacterium]|nr:SsrA-binding protein SmpB [Flavobacteriales bacterium]